MVGTSDIKALRATVERDLATFKSQRERLYQLQIHPETIKRSDRNMIVNWSRDTLKGYARQLEALESKDSLTAEDKQVMRELNTLLVVGDQLAEIMTRFAQTYEDKFGKIDNTTKERQQRSTEDRVAEIELNASRSATSSARTEPEAKTGTSTEASNASARPENDSSEKPAISKAPTSSAEGAISADPKGIYALLNLSPPVSFQIVQKAIRKKQMALHPDKNRGDPTAADRFAEFMALAEETMGTAEKKTEYDSVGA